MGDRPCVGDWMRLRCGDKVTELNGRHVGRVEQIQNSAFVVVRWLDNNWLSLVPLRDVVRLREAEYE